mmetsp:Transcript_37905/g.74571  ORF Transcript_37905/g.74571 Transcript_37905/m.74571 type:complete len:682 (-) Transcript_37905:289-2334(-)
MWSLSFLILLIVQVAGQSCQYGGKPGTCKAENLCGTGFTVSGLCPGAANIKCCIVYSCYDNAGQKGLCLNTNKCSGLNTANKCPGPSDVQCCTKQGTLPTPRPVYPTPRPVYPTRRPVYPTRRPTPRPTPRPVSPTNRPVSPTNRPVLPTPRPTPLFPTGPKIWTNTVQTQINNRGCSTAVVAGISKQLVDEVNCLRPGSFGSLNNLANIRLGDAAAKVPFAQTVLVAALRKAVAARGSTVTINSALRSIAQQLLLFKWQGTCGITIAASPGRSNHNGGGAIDINDNAGWNRFLTAQGFRWLGAGDPVHFDYLAAVDVRSLSVKAFQRLWNVNNPGDKIGEDGQYGAATESRLLKSPANGFPQGATCGSTPDNPKPQPTPKPPPQSCSVNGAAGVCQEKVTCAGTATAGYCRGLAPTIQCCTKTTPTPPPTSGGTGGTCSLRKQLASSFNIGDNGRDLIKHFEGYFATCYKDTEGIFTIGYGHACQFREPDGSGCLSGNNCAGTIDRATATQILNRDIASFVTCVRNAVRVPVNQNQFDALVAFSFNIGCGGFQDSTLLRKLNEGTLSGTDARYELSRWHSGCTEGLKRRRYAEGLLYTSCAGNGGFGCSEQGGCSKSLSYLSCGKTCQYCSACGRCSGSFDSSPTTREIRSINSALSVQRPLSVTAVAVALAAMFVGLLA